MVSFCVSLGVGCWLGWVRKGPLPGLTFQTGLAAWAGNVYWTPFSRKQVVSQALEIRALLNLHDSFNSVSHKLDMIATNVLDCSNGLIKYEFM